MLKRPKIKIQPGSLGIRFKTETSEPIRSGTPGAAESLRIFSRTCGTETQLISLARRSLGEDGGAPKADDLEAF
jgi:hypothetical protein